LESLLIDTDSESKGGKYNKTRREWYSKKVKGLEMPRKFRERGSKARDAGDASETREKLLRVLMTGMKRVIPYLSPEVDSDSLFNGMLDTLFRVAHKVSHPGTKI